MKLNQTIHFTKFAIKYLITILFSMLKHKVAIFQLELIYYVS